MKVLLKVIVGSLAVLAAFACGFLAHRHELIPRAWVRSILDRPTSEDSSSNLAGYWGRARATRAKTHSNDLSEEERSRLLALPYLQGTQPHPATQGVTVFDRDRAHEGLNLYVSGYGPEAVLMDMEGRVIHRWAVPFDTAFPDLDPQSRPLFWRRARLLDNGELLAIYEYTGLVRLDRQSEILWAYSKKNHHDVDVDKQGNIYVLGLENRRNPRRDDGALIADDVITILSPSGDVLDRMSLYDCLDRSDYASMLERLNPGDDVFHTNALRILDGTQASRSPLFREGNLLVSIRNLDAVAIIDPRSKTVVWALAGLWHRQHEPRLLDNGRMLVFDNGPESGKSRVVEVDPFRQQIVWKYEGSDDAPFHSRVGGSNQRLPNGNTLITETDFGRAIEVTPRGEIVWEFINPHRAGEDDELIAALWHVVRIDPGVWPSE